MILHTNNRDYVDVQTEILFSRKTTFEVLRTELVPHYCSNVGKNLETSTNISQELHCTWNLKTADIVST